MCVCVSLCLWRDEEGDERTASSGKGKKQEVGVLFRDVHVCETFTPFFWSRDRSLGSLRASQQRREQSERVK